MQNYIAEADVLRMSIRSFGARRINGSIRPYQWGDLYCVHCHGIV